VTATVSVSKAPSITTPAPHGTLKLIKKAEGTGKPLAGASFGVFREGANKEITRFTTEADGTAEVLLAAGDYYLLEQESPPGYLIETAHIPITVKTGEITLAEVTNERGEGLEISGEDMPFGAIEISKTGTSYPMVNAVLAGLCFVITAVCGAVLIKMCILRRQRRLRKNARACKQTV